LICAFLKPNNYGDEASYGTEELLRDHAFFVQANTLTASSAPSTSKVTDLEAEVARLREQLRKAKGVNDIMWETVVQKVIHGNHKNNQGDDMNVDDEERRKKRGRP